MFWEFELDRIDRLNNGMYFPDGVDRSVQKAEQINVALFVHVSARRASIERQAAESRPVQGKQAFLDFLKKLLTDHILTPDFIIQQKWKCRDAAAARAMRITNCWPSF